MKTIDYYNQYADQFLQATLYVDMESLYQPFLAEVPDSARILDLGCGSGTLWLLKIKAIKLMLSTILKYWSNERPN